MRTGDDELRSGAALSGRVVHQQLWETLVERLRQEILGGALPQGTKLVESELAARFGVSRGPVREALREIARLGLAVDLPRRGTFVSSPTEADLEEVLVAREAIELAGARLAIARARDEDLRALGRLLDEVDAAYAAGDIVRAWEVDLEFHRQMFEVGGNSRLLALFDPLASQTILLMRAAEDPAIRLAPEPALHRNILDALVARDVGLAEAAVVAHFRFTEDRLYRAGDNQPREE